MNGKTCGQCRHFHPLGQCWLNPPVPTAGGHALRPSVEATTLACGYYHALDGSRVCAARPEPPRGVDDVPLPTKDEVEDAVRHRKAGVVDVKDKPAGRPPAGKRGAK